MVMKKEERKDTEGFPQTRHGKCVFEDRWLALLLEILTTLDGESSDYAFRCSFCIAGSGLDSPCIGLFSRSRERRDGLSETGVEQLRQMYPASNC